VKDAVLRPLAKNPNYLTTEDVVYTTATETNKDEGIRSFKQLFVLFPRSLE
jgi:hypothetical protein